LEYDAFSDIEFNSKKSLIWFSRQMTGK